MQYDTQYNTTAILGAQWGDEGKGKLTDLLAAKANLVIRFQGGGNAGHTIYVNGEKRVLHLVPSGIFYPKTLNLIGPEVVCDPITLVEELSALFNKIPDIHRRLHISTRTPLITPYHCAIDKLRETKKGAGKIGTTGRGIGPAYEDLAARRAVVVADLFNIEKLREKIDFYLIEKNAIIKALDGTPINTEDIINKWQSTGVLDILPKLALAEMPTFINDAIDLRKHVLFEGAQGTLLDVSLGTSPFVTSSHTVSGAICTSLGVAPQKLRRIIGVMKAYLTRVGAGPFPTELFGDLAEKLREAGQEYGATTGRPRRVGWLDLPAVRYACEINGFTEIVITKADVLNGFGIVRVNNAYLLDEKIIDRLPIERIHELKPFNNIDLLGWTNVRDDLNFARFLNIFQQNLPAPISMVSCGPNRDDIIELG
jgi:adenylosuccinate synthase